MVAASGGSSSSLSGSDFPMISPFKYESGYKGWESASVNYYYDVTFKTQYDYPDVEEACGPIAATNLMIYWKNREPSKNRYPIVLLLQSHVEYGDHYVVAFEYLSFEYEDGTYSNYVQICDGRSSTANRYINFTKGFDSGSIYTITVHPN